MGGVVFNGNWLFSLAQAWGEITNLWKAALEHAWHSENGLTRQPWGVWWRSLNSQWHLKQSRLSQVTLWPRARAGALGQAHSDRQRQRTSRAEDSPTRLLPNDALQLLLLVFVFTHHVNNVWKLTFMLSQEAFTGLWNDSRLTLYVPNRDPPASAARGLALQADTAMVSRCILSYSLRTTVSKKTKRGLYPQRIRSHAWQCMSGKVWEGDE